VRRPLSEALDRRYQAWLEPLTDMRRRVADAAMLRRDIEQQIAELQPEAAGRADQLAELRRLLPGMTEAEERLTAGAPDRLRDVTAEIERELGHQAPVGDLLDLRPGAPGDSGIRILFAAEPPGTALLIAVLEGYDAVRDDYPEAVWLSAEVLARVRAGQDPEAVAHAWPSSAPGSA
jgi:hypothetical protein